MDSTDVETSDFARFAGFVETAFVWLACLPKLTLRRSSRERRLAARDDFRNWVRLGFQPEKRNENRPAVGRMAAPASGEIELTSGVIEAEQLSDPERA